MKQKYTREEVIEIMRKNVHAFKDDEMFANEVISLAAFLLDYRDYRARQDTPAPLGPHADRRPWLGRSPEEAQAIIDKIKQRAGQGASSECKVCGCVIHNESRCPRCGNVSV